MLSTPQKLLKIRPTRYLKFTFTLFFLLFSSLALAKSPRALSGHAQILWTYKKRIYRFEQAIVIQDPTSAIFETLDDFGNTILKIDFVDEGVVVVEMGRGGWAVKPSRFHKLVRLPLTRSEFIHYLLYRIPEQIEDLAIDTDSHGRIVGIEKKAKKKKRRYTISFLNFVKRGKIEYPQTIEMVSGKTTLRISWRHVSLKR